jgi:predicted DNA-binding protein YlxM (UPF0122 family)
MNTTTDTTARPWTLADIAESQNVKKRAAQNWLKRAKADHGDIGELVGTTRHFSIDERDILISYAAPPRPVKAEPAAKVQQIEAFPEFTERPAEHRPVEVVTGNHRAMVEAPAMGNAINLAQFRGDIEVLTYRDPLAAIEAASAMIDAAESAMVEDLNQRLQVLQQTQQATAKLTQRAEDLKAQQLEYKVKQDLIGIMQNTETGKLSDLLGKAQDLGGGGGQ